MNRTPREAPPQEEAKISCAGSPPWRGSADIYSLSQGRPGVMDASLDIPCEHSKETQESGRDETDGDVLFLGSLDGRHVIA